MPVTVNCLEAFMYLFGSRCGYVYDDSAGYEKQQPLLYLYIVDQKLSVKVIMLDSSLLYLLAMVIAIGVVGVVLILA